MSSLGPIRDEVTRKITTLKSRKTGSFREKHVRLHTCSRSHWSHKLVETLQNNNFDELLDAECGLAGVWEMLSDLSLRESLTHSWALPPEIPPGSHDEHFVITLAESFLWNKPRAFFITKAYSPGKRLFQGFIYGPAKERAFFPFQIPLAFQSHPKLSTEVMSSRKYIGNTATREGYRGKGRK